MERDDLRYRLAAKICWLLGHKWEDWTGRGDLRCKRCLRWEAGKPHGP